MPESPTSHSESFLARRSFIRPLTNAMLILMIVFFLVPFALRGARMALEEMHNEVQDWLPADFTETVELEWFGQHFVGERFVLLTWPGCTAEDPRMKLLVEKLRFEAVSDLHEGMAVPQIFDDNGELQVEPPPERTPLDEEKERARQFGDRHALFAADSYYQDWGGRDERWLQAENGHWYFVTPDGKVYAWEGRPNLLGWTLRGITRAFGYRSAEGEHVATFGQSFTRVGRPNPFYNDPRMLTARMFKTVETGPELVERLASRGGPLWPIGDVAEEYKPIKARRDAVERLTGTLFAPALPDGFSWEIDDFLDQLPENTRRQLPEDWRERYEEFLQWLVEEEYGGDRQAVLQATSDERAEHWYTLFDVLQVDEPPRQTAIIVTLSEVAQRNLDRALGRGLFGARKGKLLELVAEVGVSPPPAPSMAPPPFDTWLVPTEVREPAMRMGGPPVDNIAIDEEGRITQIRLIGYSILIGLVLSYICFRSIKLTIMVFFVGGLAAVTSLAFVWWFGSTADAVLMSMPPLVYVLGLSGAVHIVNYYRDAVESQGIKGAPERALRHGAWPCSVAAFTTAIALLTLNVSNIIPIQKFGFFSAIGILATLIVLFAYLPAALHVFQPRLKPRREITDVQDVLSRFWGRLGMIVTRHYRLVTIASLIVFAGLAAGLPRIDTSVQLLKLFDSEARIIKDYTWLEANLGQLVPMELVVRVDPAMMRPPRDEAAPAETPAGHQQRFQLNFLERAEMAARVQQVVEAEFGEKGQGIVGRAMSAVTLLPELPEPGAMTVRSPRLPFLSKLEEGRSDLLNSDYLRIDQSADHQGSELWRISLRVGALTDVDYGRFVHSLKDAVEPIMSAYAYRERILRAIDEDRGGQGFWRSDDYDIARVMVLGTGDPDRRAAHGGEQQGKGPAGHGVKSDVQTHIFVATLKDLLTNAGLRSTLWHDPRTHPLENDLATSDEWAEYLDSVDAVVLAQEHTDYDLEFIQQHAKIFVDARDHVYRSVQESPTAAEHGNEVHAVYTGLVPVVYKAQRTLLVSLIESIGWAFLFIAIVMSILLNPGLGLLDSLRPENVVRGISAGLVSMLPNVFPVVVIFGAMGHLDILVDIGSMMTASVAMGVAVDDTVHFLTWFRKGRRRGLSQRDAILLSYRRCAAAMTQTTLIAGLGLFVFALSTFTPTQRFGVLMLTLLVAALIGDLFVLPALLAGPLGRLFSPQRDPQLPPLSRDELEAIRENKPLFQSGPQSAEEAAAKRAEQERGQPAHGPPAGEGGEAEVRAPHGRKESEEGRTDYSRADQAHLRDRS